MGYIIAAAFVLILGALAAALVFMVKDKGQTNRTVNALTWRIGLSIVLFLGILVAYKMGWITPTGIR